MNAGGTRNLHTKLRSGRQQAGVQLCKRLAGEEEAAILALDLDETLSLWP